MPVAVSYPGVYVEELPSGVRPITGVATSITAFVGRALRGPTDAPGRVNSFGDFNRIYGGLWAKSTLGYAVQQFFLNGGSQALIVRVHNSAKPSKATVPTGGIDLISANEGDWGNHLSARIDLNTRPYDPGEPANTLFNLSVKDLVTGTIEVFRNLSTDSTNARYVTSVLSQQSQLVRTAGTVPTTITVHNNDPAAGADPFTDPTATSFSGGGGVDGNDITDNDISAPSLQPQKGLWMLEKSDLFNILCIPPLKRTGADVGKQTWDAAINYAGSRRAFVIVDNAEAWMTADDVLKSGTGVSGIVSGADNAAIYFPRLLAPDSLKEGRLDSFAPSGTIAGIFADTDAQRGVWKAPAGIETVMQGVSGLSLGGNTTPGTLTNADSGLLNPAGINCLRSFPIVGNVIWGARTLNGADMLASQWKYIPVRRLAYYIEESLFRGTQWVVFEPNADPLWAQIRLDVGAFMQTLFLQGAFQGTTPKQAYFVHCDSDTTTQTDIDNGIVNIVVGFAPLKPAEFVIIQIQQISPLAS